MLVYKGELQGIEVVIREESYTSRASFLSLDPIPNYNGNGAKQKKFGGYRESRGMYKQKGNKTRINADVNASYNLIRKAMKCGLCESKCWGFPSLFHSRGGGHMRLKPLSHEQLHQEGIPGIFDRRGIEEAARWAGSPT